ncbi:MAG TPA: YceI family protein [Gaiellaceae bacterium]|jgi:polyisoprenoid-binding protein YceI|nr:YceI family protein [Gaiellaceae bacterium]
MSVIETTTQFAPAGTWDADPVHSNLAFEVAHAGVNTFRGGFADFSATLTGGDDPTLDGTAKIASVDVKDENLNAHLQTPDFFDAQRFPEIAFRATELHRLEDERVEAAGELTLKGVTQPIELTGAIAAAPVTDPMGREWLSLHLETTIDRTAFGVSWNAPNQSGGDYVGNDVRLLVDLALIRREG